jgi:two-component system OmpR family sensor kinase
VTEPATIGRGLGRAIALATLIGMLAFGAIVATVIYIAELGEECSPGVFVDDPPRVILFEIGVAFAFAAPVGVGMSLVIARTLTRRTTTRLDQFIVSASAMSWQKLEERLPVANVGDALDRLAVALNGAFERIEGGVIEQRQFSANASHELRTPLAVIAANLEVAQRKPRDVAHWQQVANNTLTEVRRMTTLVDKLLVLSRSGAEGLHRRREELRSLAGAAVERAGQAAAEHGIAVSVAPGPPVHAEVDADAIAIVLDNLLRNAIDHSPKRQAVVVAITGDPSPCIRVDDCGPGVPADVRARIFEPFMRGPHPATDRAAGPGFGLGLAICKRIIDGHRGTIGVEDRPGGGARFVVTLKVA